METIEYTYVDKSNWPVGEWNEEPDKIQWQDKETGLPCLIVRGPSGALCGYVGVSEGHKFYGLDYASCSLSTAKKRGKKEGDKDDTFYSKYLAERLVCEEEYCEHSPMSYLDVHGGITFADFCHESPENHGICHIPGEGEPDKVWWFGFDCAHFGDFIPGHRYLAKYTEDSYKNISYVQSQCRNLALQLLSFNNYKGQ